MPTETPMWLIEHLKQYKAALDKMKDGNWRILPFPNGITDPAPAQPFLGRMWTRSEIRTEINNIDLWLAENGVENAH